jgi:hypothetical protein
MSLDKAFKICWIIIVILVISLALIDRFATDKLKIIIHSSRFFGIYFFLFGLFFVIFRSQLARSNAERLRQWPILRLDFRRKKVDHYDEDYKVGYIIFFWGGISIIIVSLLFIFK